MSVKVLGKICTKLIELIEVKLKSFKPTQSVVLILDPRGLLSPENLDSIKRHESYAEELFKSSEKHRLRLVAISSARGSLHADLKLDFLSVYYISKPTFNAVLFAVRSALFVLKKSFKVELVIASDPWESYWSAYFFRKILRSMAIIQIQLHGDFGNPLWKKLNIRNRIRHFLLRFSIRNVNFFRTVGTSQSKFFIENFKLDPKNLVIAPVPISSFGQMRDSKFRDPRTLGFIGRIAQDRGTKEFTELVAKLSRRSQDFQVAIIGSGPKKDVFLSGLEVLIPKSKIHFYGQLSEKDLQNTWINISVLVSVAPTESYGRVMREALVAGVPVWATPSSGVLDLISKAGDAIVKKLDLSKSEAELDKELNQLFECKVPSKFRNLFMKENSNYAKLLVESWVDLVNK